MPSIPSGEARACPSWKAHMWKQCLAHSYQYLQTMCCMCSFSQQSNGILLPNFINQEAESQSSKYFTWTPLCPEFPLPESCSHQDQPTPLSRAHTAPAQWEREALSSGGQWRHNPWHSFPHEKSRNAVTSPCGLAPGAVPSSCPESESLGVLPYVPG